MNTQWLEKYLRDRVIWKSVKLIWLLQLKYFTTIHNTQNTCLILKAQYFWIDIDFYIELMVFIEIKMV